MTEYFYVQLLSKPNKNYEQSPVPQIGSTGRAFNSVKNQVVVEWDKDNPICANFKTKSVLGTSHLKTITEEAYNNYKLKNATYIKSYLNKLYDINIKEPNPRLYKNEVLRFFNLGKDMIRPSIFMGCKFIRPLFTTTDMSDLYFVGCTFEEPLGVMEETEISFSGSKFIDTDTDPLYEIKQIE